MDDERTIAALARAAGLDKALSEFPDDVAAALRQAMTYAAPLAAPMDPTAEPWPPMCAERRP